MSIKIIADSLTDFPDQLRSEAKEVDGKFELDGAGVLKKNSELLGKNAKLTSRAEEAEAAKDASDANAQEWKGKAKIPTGHKVVAQDVAELGEAAKAAEISKDELPTLKGAKADLQSKIDAFEGEKVISDVAQSLGFNNRFAAMAKDKNLKFEKTTEKVDGKDVDVWNVVGSDNSKTKVGDFIKQDAYFKEFADTFASADKSGGKRYLGQESGQDRQSSATKFDAIEREVKEREKTSSAAVGSTTDRFYNRQQAVTE